MSETPNSERGDLPVAMSREIRLRVRALNKFLQPGFDRRLSKELAEYFDLPSQLVVWNRLYKSLGCG
jgi:hypothetical protein